MTVRLICQAVDCQKEFLVKPSRVGTAKFCSRPCSNRNKDISHLAEANRKKMRKPDADGNLTCSKCKGPFPIEGFAKDATSRLGISTLCVYCSRAKSLGYYYENSVEINEYRRSEEFKVTFRPYQAAWGRERWKADPNYRIKRSLRHRLWKALKGAPKSGHAMDLIGCSVDELRMHLEGQFRPGMSWDNYGQPGWEIDHIRPCASFDLTDPEQQRQCFHYTNLQPLWGFENASKNKKYEMSEAECA